MIDVVIFNGPPQCGKDTAKQFILDQYGTVEELRFAAPLKRGLHELLCLDNIEEEAWAHLKGMQSEEAFNKDMRDCYISLSEDFAKPLFGPDIFGKLWMRNYHRLLATHKTHVTNKDPVAVIQYYPMMVIADCGFAAELEPLIAHFGANSICIIEIHRPTCDYSNDSRGYIQHKEIPTYRLINQVNDLERYERDLFALLEEIGVLSDL